MSFSPWVHRLICSWDMFLLLPLQCLKHPNKAFHLWKCHTSLFQVWLHGSAWKEGRISATKCKYHQISNPWDDRFYMVLCFWIQGHGWRTHTSKQGTQTQPRESEKQLRTCNEVQLVSIEYAWKVFEARLCFNTWAVVNPPCDIWIFGYHHWNHRALIHTDRGPKLLHVPSADLSSFVWKVVHCGICSFPHPGHE